MSDDGYRLRLQPRNRRAAWRRACTEAVTGEELPSHRDVRSARGTRLAARERHCWERLADDGGEWVPVRGLEDER